MHVYSDGPSAGSSTSWEIFRRPLASASIVAYNSISGVDTRQLTGDTTMDAICPRAISERWLNGRRQVLAITTTTLSDGTPNPAHAEIAVEVAEAEAELARWVAFESWVASALNLRANSYPVRHGGQTLDAGKAFCRKDKATGRLTVLSRDEAWTKYQEARRCPTS